MTFNNISITQWDLIVESHEQTSGNKKPEYLTYGSGRRVWLQYRFCGGRRGAINSDRAGLGTGCQDCAEV